MTTSPADRGPHTGWYRIQILGRLAPRWATRFDGMSLTDGDDGTTLIQGHVIDQAALHGLLQHVRDTGLPLISVTRAEHDPTRLTTPPSTTTTQPRRQP